MGIINHYKPRVLTPKFWSFALPGVQNPACEGKLLCWTRCKCCIGFPEISPEGWNMVELFGRNVEGAKIKTHFELGDPKCGPVHVTSQRSHVFWPFKNVKHHRFVSLELDRSCTQLPNLQRSRRVRTAVPCSGEILQQFAGESLRKTDQNFIKLHVDDQRYGEDPAFWGAFREWITGKKHVFFYDQVYNEGLHCHDTYHASIHKQKKIESNINGIGAISRIHTTSIYQLLYFMDMWAARQFPRFVRHVWLEYTTLFQLWSFFSPGLHW